jgi:hypothetical protein
MTQDQYGQARGPGYVIRGDVVPEDETEEFPAGESKPMTRFQKVASALRGGGAERDEQDQAGTDPATDPHAPAVSPPWVTQQDEAVAVTSPGVPAGPDGADHAATEPDMFGTTTHTGDGTAATVAPAAQAGAATIADVPASTVPAPDDEATGTTGRHAAGTPADSELRPGEAAGNLGDFSDLTYGNLIPDAAHYTAQWQQIQFRFVDDPRASVTEAADIVAQVTAKMEAAIQERQRAIQERQRAIAERQRSLRDRWGEGANADTETLRETLRMYKTFLNQLIGPQAG